MALDLAAKLKRLSSAGPESRAPRPADGATDSARAPGESWPTETVIEAADPRHDVVSGARRDSFTPRFGSVSSRDARIAELRARLDAFLARSRAELPRRSPRREAPPLPGNVVATQHGEVHVVDHVLAPDHCHGRTAVARATSVPGATLASLALDERLATIDARKMLLLDTETTGLSGGTGSLAFLIGTAWFEDDSLVVRQLLLRRPGQEAPILHALREKIVGSSAIVTFNGKSFDWPLLRTRFVMNRVAIAEPERHLDLLHCARRVFARRLEGVRLTALEEAVLGMRRERDIDGAEIPGAYLSYIRGQDDGTMARVLEHNLHDLVALAALVVALSDRWARPDAADDPRDQMSLARVAIRAKDDTRAVAFAEAAAEGSPGSRGGATVSSEALRLVALIAKRRGDAGAAGDALRRALDAAPDDADVHLALAKHYEHHERAFSQALDHARRAVPAESEEQNAIRIARLERRLSRTVERSRRLSVPRPRG